MMEAKRISRLNGDLSNFLGVNALRMFTVVLSNKRNRNHFFWVSSKRKWVCCFYIRDIQLFFEFLV